MPRRPHQHAVLASVAAFALLACGSEGGSADAASAEAAAPKAAAKPAKAEDGHEDHDHAQRAERPLPAFGGWTLDDERLQISSLIGKRLLIFFFNPEVDGAAVVARAISRISKLRAKQNFEIVGVATGVANMYEISTHLRGEAGDRQVEGAKAGLTHVIGLGSACAIHILEKVA